MCAAKLKAYYSKFSVKRQTVLPREVRERPKITPGDRLRSYVVDDGVRIEKAAPAPDDDPSRHFGRGSEADEEAIVDLWGNELRGGRRSRRAISLFGSIG